MATLTLRLIKGSPLTNAEVDANFTSLDQNKVQLGGDLGGSTSSPVVTKLQGFSVSSATPTTGTTLTWTGLSWAPSPGLVNLSVNDISNRYNALDQVFTLKTNNTALTGTEYGDERDLEVVVGGRRLEPWVQEFHQYYPWFNEMTAARANSYKMKGAKIILYSAPTTKTTGFIKINTKSASRQIRKYPIPPNNIALGD